MGKIIVFLGPVGVGKSTTIKTLKTYLDTVNVKTHTFFIKAFHGPSFVLWYIVLSIVTRRRRTKLQNVAPWYLLGRYHPKLGEGLTKISLLLDTFIAIPVKVLVLKLLSKCKLVILCEECVLGGVIDYLYSFRRNKSVLAYVSMEILLSLYYSLRADTIVYLFATTEDLKNRWHSRGYGDPQLPYVIYQQISFLVFQKYEKSQIFAIDTSGKRPKDVLLDLSRLLRLLSLHK